MANPRQRRKEKSSTPKVTRRTNDKIRKHKIKGNAIIAANWNPKETLSQNYKRLGLVSRLSKQTGGTEVDLDKESSNRGSKEDNQSRHSKRLLAGEAKIERDNQGNAIRVIYGKTEESSSDNEDEQQDPEQDSSNNPVIKALEQQAANGYVKPRKQSDREGDWIQRLVEKHGDDYDAMFWDKKLNIYQQSKGDLMRRIKKWKKDTTV